MNNFYARNPYAYSKKPKYVKPAIQFNADDIWAAAWQAYIINNKRYIKDPVDQHEKSNRSIVQDLFNDPVQITDESRKQGQLVRSYFKGLTFKLIEGQSLTPFMKSAYTAATKDVIDNNLELAIIASLPMAYEKAVERDNVNRKVTFAKGGYLGIVGDKINIDIEVIKQVWSEKWNTWFITAMTTNENVLFFPFKNQLLVGQNIKVTGTVKAHDNTDNKVTKLCRVKVV